jgi:DNA-binding LacI/PurR family transcriptional regulator
MKSLRAMADKTLVRIEDVAREAGVSPASVSNAFNRRLARISPKTRQRILAVAARLNYTPNAAASSLRSRRTHAIGAVVTNILNPFYTSVVRGIQDAARHSGYSVFVCNTDDDASQEHEMLQLLRAKQVDGLLLVATGANRRLRQLVSSGIPIVLLDRKQVSLHLDTVRIDNETASHQAVEYLFGLGHRRIALLSGPAHGISTRMGRIAGYDTALAQNDIRPREEYKRQVPTDTESGARATRQLLDLRDPPTALFVTNTFLAIGALAAIQERGLRIPADLSFLMFDDPEWAKLVKPQITSIAQPTMEIGRAAFELLRSRLKGENGPPQEVVLATKFMLRESCAAPASGKRS